MLSTDTRARHVLFLASSGRRDGNSERLAQVAAAALPDGVTTTWLHHDELPLPPFEDRRHGGIPYAPPAGHERVLFDATLAASDVVFVAPIYWYGLPAAAKLYLDYWSAWLRATEVDFAAHMRGRALWLIAAMSDEDARFAAPAIEMLRLSAGYMAMRWGGVLLGYGNRPGDIAADTGAIERARRFLLETV